MKIVRDAEDNYTVTKKEGRKKLFYLTIHLTPFNYCYTGVRHMVKDKIDCEIRNLLPAIILLILPD